MIGMVMGENDQIQGKGITLCFEDRLNRVARSIN